MDASAKSEFRCAQRHVVDALGRVRLFRGANVSGRAKLPPFLPLSDPSLLVPLKKWGFNTIRLLLMWEALEPERGALDEHYLEQIRKTVAQAGRLGLHVIIDFHQDLYARQLGGDGAPSWAVRSPSPPVRGQWWFLGYLTSSGVRKSQRAFWSNVDGIQTAFLRTVQRVMQGLRDEPAIIGYDFYNEPMTDVRGLFHGAFEQSVLADFHKRCIAIRDEFAPGRLVFFEPTPLASFGFGSRLPPLQSTDVVYAPHMYDATAIAAQIYLRATSTGRLTFRRLLDQARRLQVPMMVGEFGAIHGLRNAASMLEDECEAFDRHFLSWTVWHYDPSDEDWNNEKASIVRPGGERKHYTDPLIRPYPKAIAGQPVRWRSRVGQPWEFVYLTQGRAQTEIVIPPLWAPRGFEFEVSGADAVVEGELLLVRARSVSSVTVRLRR